jgi:hypothetical protein
MDIENAAQTAIDAVGEHVIRRAGGRVETLADQAVDRLADLIGARLSGSATGRRRLQQLYARPDDTGARHAAAEVLGDEAHADPRLAADLDILVRTVQQSYSVNQNWSSTTYGGISTNGRSSTAVQGSGNVVNTGRLKQTSRTFPTGRCSPGSVANRWAPAA